MSCQGSNLRRHRGRKACAAHPLRVAIVAVSHLKHPNISVNPENEYVVPVGEWSVPVCMTVLLSNFSVNTMFILIRKAVVSFVLSIRERISSIVIFALSVCMPIVLGSIATCSKPPFTPPRIFRRTFEVFLQHRRFWREWGLAGRVLPPWRLLCNGWRETVSARGFVRANMQYKKHGKARQAIVLVQEPGEVWVDPWKLQTRPKEEGGGVKAVTKENMGKCAHNR